MYRSCHWPGGLAGSPQCVRPWGCGSLRPVSLPPLVCVRVRCPGPLGACSPVGALLCLVCGVGGHSALVHRCARCVLLVRVVGGFVGGPPPSVLWFCPYLFVSFLLLLFVALVLLCLLFFLCFRALAYPLFVLFFFEKCKWKRGACTLQAQAWATGAAVQQCCVPRLRVRRWCFVCCCAPGVRHARLEVHGWGFGWVRLGVSLPLG